MVAWARDEISIAAPVHAFITEELWAVTAANADGASSSPPPLWGKAGGGEPQTPAPVPTRGRGPHFACVGALAET